MRIVVEQEAPREQQQELAQPRVVRHCIKDGAPLAECSSTSSRPTSAPSLRKEALRCLSKVYFAVLRDSEGIDEAEGRTAAQQADPSTLGKCDKAPQCISGDYIVLPVEHKTKDPAWLRGPHFDLRCFRIDPQNFARPDPSIELPVRTYGDCLRPGRVANRNCV